jgi:hypothetical protein
MSDCGMADPPLNWNSIALWSLQNMKGKTLQAMARRLCFAAAIYNLQLHRNALLNGPFPKFEEGILPKIRWEVKVRLLAKFPPK